MQLGNGQLDDKEPVWFGVRLRLSFGAQLCVGRMSGDLFRSAVYLFFDCTNQLTIKIASEMFAHSTML